MQEEYIVEAVNFVAHVGVDLDLCDCPYMEAATRALENVFRPPPSITAVTNYLKLLKKPGIVPIVGSNVFVWKNGDIGDDKKVKVIPTKDVARNAGLLEIVRELERA